MSINEPAACRSGGRVMPETRNSSMTGWVWRHWPDQLTGPVVWSAVTSVSAAGGYGGGVRGGGVEKRKGRRETEKGKRGKGEERKGRTGETKIKWGNGGEEEQEGKC